jgi:probable rRNA maturation factor
MTFDIDVQLACAAHDLPRPAKQMAEQVDVWVRAALVFPQTAWQRKLKWQAVESFHQAAQLTVRIVDIAESTALNQDYRHRQGPTNVLSFPFDEPFQLQPPLLGDVVICAPRVVEEARQQGKPVLAHWAHLVVHGVLHLLGYDHLEDEQARVMETLEILVLARLGYPNPYDDEVDNQEGREAG